MTYSPELEGGFIYLEIEMFLEGSSPLQTSYAKTRRVARNPYEMNIALSISLVEI